MSMLPAHAIQCGEYTQSPSSESPSFITILDTDIGTEAYLRLGAYSNGGHRALGIAIASKFNYFNNCEYVGIGIGDGSGGNGYRPNFTLWMWRNGLDVTIARAAIYELVGASANPVVTNGDCNISCDGTFGRQFDGTYISTTTSSTTTTTTTTTATTIAPSSSNNSQGSQIPIANGNENGVNSSSGTFVETTTTTISYVIGAAMPESTSFSSPQIITKTFKNCSEVNRIYPRGVAKTLAAAKKQKKYSKSASFVSASLYTTLARMDRNKDLTACEK
jgi:hypothetical protein